MQFSIARFKPPSSIILLIFSSAFALPLLYASIASNNNAPGDVEPIDLIDKTESGTRINILHASVDNILTESIS